MKYIPLLWILLFSPSCADSQSNSGIITISQVRDGGNGHYYIVIGNDEKSTDDAANGFKFNKDFTSKFVIDKSTFNSLHDFMSRNCIRNNTINDKSFNYFTVRLISKNDTIVCYLENDTLSKPYFEQLTALMNKMSCDATCVKLKSEFEAILRSISFKEPQ